MAEAISAPRRFLLQTDAASLRFAAFLSAILIYAFYGTPTPDRLGWVEISTGLLLVLAAGLWRAASILRRDDSAGGWRRPAQILLLYGLTVPVLTGIANGNDTGAMLRDVIPFLFFLLPLFFTALAAKGNFPRVLTAAVLAAGLAFAGRVLLPLYSQRYGFTWQVAPPADPFYLTNAPTVLFAALCLGGLGGWHLYRGAHHKNLLRAALLFALALPPLVAMALITQRASMGMVALYAAALLGLAVIRKPYRAIPPLLALLVLIMAGWPGIDSVLQVAMQKTTAVGLNMRWQEARAILDLVGQSFGTALFGKGWGATFASPAVGGVIVNFTHNLLTTYWLKTGLCGLALALAYIFHIFVALGRVVRRYPVLGLALAAPLLIDIMLYASFKSLDFGLILLLIAVWGEGCTKIPSGVCKEEPR